MTIKVIRGNPTPEELAAALAVVHARAAATTPPPRPTHHPDSWADPSHITTHHLPQPGPTAWNRTYWPH